MQQTDKYKLNLIDTGDDFSPNPLNKNMKTLETQLARVDAAAAAEKARVDSALAAKAAQSALDAEKTARETAAAAEKTRVDAALAAKAAQTALAAETAAREALAARVGTLEAGKLLWKFDHYTGDGTFGKGTPTRLEFPFKPLMLIITDPVSGGYGGIPWLYGESQGLVNPGPSNGISVTLTWEDRAVQWYSTNNAVTAIYQLNSNGCKYPYFVLGIEK